MANVKPGDTLYRTLQSFGIRGDGCNWCQELRQKMNRLGSAGCLENLEELSEDLRSSAGKWIKQNGSNLPIPSPLIARSLIRWSCR